MTDQNWSDAGTAQKVKQAEQVQQENGQMSERMKLALKYMPMNSEWGSDSKGTIYAPEVIQGWTQLYKDQGKEIDPGWVQNEYQRYGSYVMSQPTDSYWENPQNVGRWQSVVNALPQGVKPPSWLNTETLGQAYSYLSEINGGSSDWWNWNKGIDQSDPARLVLRGMTKPAEQDLPDYQKYFAAQDEAIKALTESGQPQPGTNDPTAPDVTQQGAFGAYPEGLPWWQYPMIAAQSSAGQVGTNALMGGMMGGSIAGLPGAAVGSGAGALLGLVSLEEVKKQADPNYQMPFWMQALNFLDIGAAALERGIGFTQQLLNDPNAVLANPGAAWEAGQFAYEVTDVSNAGELKGKLADVAAGTPLSPFIQAQKFLNQGKESSSEAYNLGEAKAFNVWKTPDGKAPSDYAMTTIRGNLANGTWTPEQAASWVYNQFGAAGAGRDLLGHMFLDPMNYLGQVSSVSIKGGAKLAKAMGNTSKDVELIAKSFEWKELLDNTRMFVKNVRDLPPSETKNLSTLTKVISGISDNGMPYDLLNKDQVRGALAKFFAPNAYSRANTFQEMAAQGLARLMESESPEGALNATLKLIDTHPEDVINGSESLGKIMTKIGGEDVEIDIPRYWASVEGQSIIMGLRDAKADLLKFDDLMKQSAAKRKLILNIATYHPDYGPEKGLALIDTLKGADAATATRILEQARAGLAAMGTGADKRLVKTLERLTGDGLMNVAKPFIKGSPLTAPEFKKALFEMLALKLDDFSVKYYGVKPDKMVFRLSKLIKTMQSILVLGPNPSYWVNNLLSNAVHLAADGLLDATSVFGRKEWIKAMYGDNAPAALRVGVGAADVERMGAGAGLRNAVREKGVIQGMQDALGRIPKILTPFQVLSSKGEELASEIAFVHGMREYWGKMWDAGKGFDQVSKFDPQLAQVLDTFVPGGAKKIERMIRAGRNRAEIEEAIFKGFQYKSVADVVSNDDLPIVQAFPDLFDGLDKKLKAAKSDADVVAALGDLQKEFTQKVKSAITEQTKMAVMDAFNKVKVEGSGQALVEALDGLVHDYNSFWAKYQDDLGDVWRQAEKMSGEARDKFLDDKMDAFRNAWDAYEQTHDAQWSGMADAMGGGKGAPAEWLPILSIRRERAQEWSTFFLERDALLRETRADAKAATNDAERSQIWDAYFAKANENYQEMIAWEHMINRVFQDLTVREVGKTQPELRDSYTQWVDGQHSVRLQMMAAESLYRTGNLPQADATAMANRFVKQHPELVALYNQLDATLPDDQKFGIQGRILAAAEEVANATLPAEIASAISKITGGLPEHRLFGIERANAKKAYAQVRAAYVKTLMDARNTPAGTVPKPPADAAAAAAQAAAQAERPKKQPTIYSQKRTLTPIFEAMKQAALDINEPWDYFIDKNGNYQANHIAAALGPEWKNKLTQMTQEDLDAAIAKWQEGHLQRREEAAKKAKPPEGEAVAGAEKPVQPEQPPAAGGEAVKPEVAGPDVQQKLDELRSKLGEEQTLADFIERDETPEAAQKRAEAQARIDALKSEIQTLEEQQVKPPLSGEPVAGNATDGDPIADLRAKVTQQEREVDAKLADALGEFKFGRQDLEASLRRQFPGQVDAWMEMFDSLAANFNSELTAKAFYEQLGWMMGGEYEEGPGLRQVRMATDTPEFRNWFGDSKIVDAEGKPLVVYHGTDRPGFSEFSAKNKRNIDYGDALYFTSDAVTASDYSQNVRNIPGRTELDKEAQPLRMRLAELLRQADRPTDEIRQISARLKEINTQLSKVTASRTYQAGNAAVYPVYLKMENPLVVDGGRRFHSDVMPGLIEQAKANGHDGLIVKNIQDPASLEGMGEAITTYAVFDNTQVKSTFNRGTFDPKNPNMLFQQEQGKVLGLTRFSGQMKALINVFDQSDPLTFAHELIHGITPMMKQSDADIVRAEWKRMTGVELEADWHKQFVELENAPGKYTAKHTKVYEWLSDEFEKYMQTGKAPTKKLQPVFEQIKAWVVQLYADAKGGLNDIQVNPVLDEMFGRWLGKEAEPSQPSLGRSSDEIYRGTKKITAGPDETVRIRTEDGASYTLKDGLVTREGETRAMPLEDNYYLTKLFREGKAQVEAVKADGSARVLHQAMGKPMMEEVSYKQANLPIGELPAMNRPRQGELFKLDKPHEDYKLLASGDDIAGTVNNRVEMELSLFERILGRQLPGGREVKMGKGDKPPKRAMDANELGQHIWGIVSTEKGNEGTGELNWVFKKSEQKQGVKVFKGKEKGPLTKVRDRYFDADIVQEALKHGLEPSESDQSEYFRFIRFSQDLRDDWNVIHTDRFVDKSGNTLKVEQMILSNNGKAGHSVDFILGTCLPTTPCRECYAAERMIRGSAVEKAMRNTILMIQDPEAFGRQIAREITQGAYEGRGKNKRVVPLPKTEVPFLRLLGSGDLTSDEMVVAFNTMAQNMDRTMQIFSRHHERLAQLNGTQQAPFVKMGSIDIDLYNYYNKRFGPDYLVNNMRERGINNAFLYTELSELPAIADLYNKNSLGLILSAEHGLHDGLPRELKIWSCPCDAGERTYSQSCRACGLSQAGCFMVYANTVVDSNGKLVDIRNLPLEGMTTEEFRKNYRPMLDFFYGMAKTEGPTYKAQSFLSIVGAQIKKSIELVNLYKRDLTKDKIKLNDIRGGEIIYLVDGEEILKTLNAAIEPGQPKLTFAEMKARLEAEDPRNVVLNNRQAVVKSANDYIERMRGVEKIAQDTGDFWLPGGEKGGEDTIQPAQYFLNFRKVDLESIPAETRRAINITEGKYQISEDEINSGELYRRQKAKPTPSKPIEAQAGTADSLTQPPVAKAALEGYLEHVGPMMSRWQDGLTGETGRRAQVMGLNDLPKDAQLGMRRYLGRVYSQMNDVKMGATKWGESRRNFALLDYGRRNDFDSLLGMLMPYQFWYTRSAMNWALRALERPSIVTNYLRLREFAQQAEDKPGFPTRLKGKMEVPLPWLPSWAGKSVYVDPLQMLYPIDNYVRPFEQYGQTLNMVQRRTVSLIDEAAQNEEITAAQADEARNTQGGPVWEKYYQQADMDVRKETPSTLGAPVQPGNIRNGIDLAFSMLGPSLPLSMGYAMATGRKDTIGLLPLTKFIKNTSGLLGANNGQGWNIEAPIRQAFGWPEQDRYADYRMDAAIAQMMADGEMSAEEAKTAMVDRTGPAFAKAQGRAGAMERMRYVGAPFGLDLFPEGEKEVRALKDEYTTARNQWQAGDKKALSAFYEKYPEYDVRNFSFKTPEERVRSYLISSIWEGYNGLNSAEQKAMGRDNELFQTAFLSKQTRSYDSIDLPTLAAWAQRVGQKTPKAAGAVNGQAPLMNAQDKALMDAYEAEKEQRFPGLKLVEDLYYSLPKGPLRDTFSKKHPEVEQSFKWETQRIAAQPQLSQYLTGPKSKLYGLPVSVQGPVYQFWASKDSMFPGIEDKQEKYFSFAGKDEQKAYLKAHPELSEYWDWRKQYAAQFPTAAPYILSANTIANALLGNNGYGGGGGSYQSTVKIPTELARTVLEHSRSGVKLSLGVDSETRRLMARMKVDPEQVDMESFLRGLLPQMADMEHPEALNQGELGQIPPELVRALTAYKWTGAALGAGALKMIEQYRKRLEVRGDLSDEAFIESYLMPAIQ